MATELTREQWDELGARLREPFDPKEVDFRVQGKASANTGKTQAVCYVDARTVQDRLDAVVGPGAWSFDWTPLVVEKGDVQVAKGTLTIHGVSKSDVGSASNFEATLGAVSHCFKRAAVHWGVGRYLYGLPPAWVTTEGNGQRIPEATVRELRSRLPRPTTPTTTTPAGSATADETPPTETQWASIRKLCDALGVIAPDATTIHTAAQAHERIADLSERYKRYKAQQPAPAQPASVSVSAPSAPASLRVDDMDAHRAAVATTDEQRKLVAAIKAKGYNGLNAVSGFVSASITRPAGHELDIAALGKAQSDITNGEVRTLMEALAKIKTPVKPRTPTTPATSTPQATSAATA